MFCDDELNDAAHDKRLRPSVFEIEVNHRRCIVVEDDVAVFKEFPNVGRSRVLAKVFGGFSCLEWRLPENHHPDSPFYLGRVHLKNPDRNFWLMETDGHGAHNGLPPVVQRRIFFGRQVGGADRKLLPTYPLKSLKYLGPATLDGEMAFLMANQAYVTPGKAVYDPFV
ncbi:hypothetical protein NC652_008047 [Populus alba x Populus x berolinensis]|nr:hypothetical protein NC652_008047 [Populus alba x Populus x berolinensis]